MVFTISKGIILQVQMDFQGEGESEVCVSWLFSVGTIQAVLLKKKHTQTHSYSQTECILIAKGAQKTSFTSSCLRKPL